MKGGDDSDSDGPPEETSISMGKDIFAEEETKIKNEVLKLKNQVKEARRLKHERNRNQQVKKRERLQKLEASRLPLDLLEAVVMEKDKPKIITTPEKKKRRKVAAKKFDNIDTFERGLKVQAVGKEDKKYTSIATIAADFRKQALYNKAVPRMKSRDYRIMTVRQTKAGKN